MDWLFGGFMLFPFCLVSTCGIPLLILIVVLIFRGSRRSISRRTGHLEMTNGTG